MQKREIPKFDRLVLDYPLFKRNWSIEISLNCLPEHIKINHLKSAVPALSKDRLYEVVNLSEAWSILDQIYGQKFDLLDKLKQEFMAIKVSSKVSPYIEIELYEKVHKWSAKIKAACAHCLL